MPDATFRNEGTLFLLTPCSDQGRAWCAEHLPADSMQWCGSTLVEPRYVRDILEGMINDGLEISDPSNEEPNR